MTFSPDLEAFVREEVNSGRFRDADAVVVHALQLLKRERDEAIAGINEGLADVAAGRVQPLSEAFDELRGSK